MEQVRQILQQALSQIPETAYGVERQMVIGDLISQFSQEDKTLLKRTLDGFLIKMFQDNSSDIDMGGYGSQGYLWYRTYGIKKPDQTAGKFKPEEISALVQNVIMERQRQFLYENRNLDFSYFIMEGEKMHRFRADAYFDLDQLALNMRAINAAVRPFKNLELHPNVTKVLSLAHSKEGLTLVTGITGSGKSSTLDSIIDANNHSVDAHIVIIGAPIEYVHQSDRCIIRHREVGRDVMSFKEGAVQALRQDPDIIMIGEMRDPETIFTSLEITDSGHKVFSTLHTASAVESIDRIIGEVPPMEQERVRFRLADVLRCVISQKLVPSIDGKRIMAKEILLGTPSVRAAIKNNNTGEIYQMISESSDLGMVSLEQDLKRLYMMKRISLENAMNFANNKRRMQQLLSVTGAAD